MSRMEGEMAADLVASRPKRQKLPVERASVRFAALAPVFRQKASRNMTRGGRFFRLRRLCRSTPQARQSGEHSPAAPCNESTLTSACGFARPPPHPALRRRNPVSPFAQSPAAYYPFDSNSPEPRIPCSCQCLPSQGRPRLPVVTWRKNRAHSSVGLERVPDKDEVRSSNLRARICSCRAGRRQSVGHRPSTAYFAEIFALGT
jgi:hypothetical protein